MHTSAVTFTAGPFGAENAVNELAEIGFEFGPPQTLTRTLLDTFDGRLHSAGLRLELRQCGGCELSLSGRGIVAAHLAVPSVPRFTDELPPGPFRARLAAIVEVRALLAIVGVTATETRGTLRDRAGKAVVSATLYDHLRVDDRPAVDLVPWTIELDELRGYAKPAGKAFEVLDHLGLSRLGGDTLTEAAAAAGIDPAGFSGSPTVALDPDMPAIDGFRVVFTNLADTMVANWRGTIDQIDTEFLHDFRVAVRRTRAVLGQGKNVVPPAIVERAVDRFRWLGTFTGPARDLDVYLIEWDSYTGQLGAGAVAALEPVRELLETRCRAAHAALDQALQSTEAAELMTTWQTWLNEPISDDAHGTSGGRPLAQVVTKRIARAQANLIEGGRRIRPETPATEVHDLRKAAKKLRYLLECFGSLLPAAPRKAFVRRLKAFQDNLGEHQDAEVHVAELRAIAPELHQRGAPSVTMLAIGQLTEQLDQRRIAARTEFADRFAAYDTRATQRALDDALAGVGR